MGHTPRAGGAARQVGSLEGCGLTAGALSAQPLALRAGAFRQCCPAWGAPETGAGPRPGRRRGWGQARVVGPGADQAVGGERRRV
jgi:hypothetical protein